VNDGTTFKVEEHDEAAAEDEQVSMADKDRKR